MGATKISIDFTSAAHKYRQQHGGGLGQLIAKAVGVKSKYKPFVLDCTAGLGEDAFVLASLGCKVLMLERSSEVAAALKTALNHALQMPNYQHLKLNLINIDAIDYLMHLKSDYYPDVIYMDPMFPQRKKTALNKKSMRELREIVGEDFDAPKLLSAALCKAKKRIVVKRHRLAPIIEGLPPNFTYEGKSSRFDVYVPSGLKKQQTAY